MPYSVLEAMQVVSTPNTSADWISQKPGSFNCEKMMEPVPVANTSSSGRTPMWPAMGASTDEATAMATVAEPMETRMTAASSQASTSGGR